jgi:hypothetical protein
MSREPGRGSSRNFAKLALAAVLLSLAFSFVPARPAHAQWIVNDIVATAKTVYREIKDTLKDAFVTGVATAFVSSVDYFASEMAYQMAMMLVAECPGGKPCWETMSLGDALKSAGEGAVGTMVETLSKEGGFEKLGLNLCAPPSPNLMLSIQLGLLRDKRPPKPNCDFNTLVGNWSSLASSLTDAETYTQMWQGFKPGTAPLSASFIAFNKSAELEVDMKNKKQSERQMQAAGGGGFIDVKDMVSKSIKTPSGAMKKAYDDSADTKKKGETASTAVVTGQMARGSIFGAIVSNAVSTFAQTLIAQGFNRVVSGLLSSSEADLAAEPEILLSETGVVYTSTDKVAAAVKSRFSVVKVVESGTFDPSTSFTSCPSTNRGSDNCVMDAQFAKAVVVSQGSVLTIRDALEKGMLHGDWPLISAKDTVKNTSDYCYTQGYCETNLKKLRAARIISIGWEIAAHKSSTTSPTKLKDVIAGFDDCNDEGEADASHKWCHLIDPDWPLVQPPTMCRATVYGPQLASSESATRSEVCVDKVSCLRQDDSGTCVGGYGYCTRERNIWRFNADSCPEYYASCRSYKPSDGGAVVSYLANTIEHGSCNADNVGCAAYSAVKNAFTCDCSTDTCSGTVTSGVCKTAKGCSCTKDYSCTVKYGERRCLSSRGETCTISSGSCTTATGCACTVKYACTVSDGSKYCTTTEGDDTTTEDDWLNTPARYFTDGADSCTSTDAGCTALMELDTDESLNLVRNGSFEELEDADGDGATDHPMYWIPFGAVPTGSYASPKSDSTLATDGSYAVHVGPVSGAVSKGTCTLTTGACATETGCNCATSSYGCLVPWQGTTCYYTNRLMQDGIPVQGKRNYTLSADFRSASTISTLSLPKLRLSFKDTKGNNLTLTSNDISVSGDENETTGYKYCSVSSSAVVVEGMLDSTDTTGKKASATCTFSVDASVAEGILEVVGPSGIYVDSVMLEAGGGTGDFHEEYGDASTGTYLKVAPSYLGCTGDSTDDEDCASYASVCREDEVGCELYTPANGDPDVPAVISDADECPSECAGYDMFKQAASDFDQAKFPLYFIPSTATECSDSDVGCSEFTDLDTEEESYYSKLRLCTDSADTDVYYTWEGSDTTGYQLKVWDLKPTGATVAPPTSVVEADGKTYYYDACPTGTTSCPDAGYAPCTQIKWVAGAMTCVDSYDDKGWCTAYDIDTGDSDCRELTDQNGNRHYRRISRTVIAGSCSRLRATVSTQADCEGSNGLWDSTRLDCVYRADSTESTPCSASVNGCRSYQGNAAENIRNILTDDIESDVDDWTGTAAESTESINPDGHSLKMAKTSAASVSFTQYVQSLVGSERFYSLQFWAKGVGTLKPKFDYGSANKTCTLSAACAVADGCECTSTTENISCTVTNGSSSCTVQSGSTLTAVPLTTKVCMLGSTCTAAAGCACTTDGKTCTVEQNDSNCNVTDVGVKLTGDWKSYQVGPIKAPKDFGTYAVRLTFTLEGTAIGDAYIDNIILKEVKDSTALVRDSWSTPVSCDSTPDGAYSPRFMLGCREYADSEGEEVYLRSFSQLCREQAVGCAAYSSLDLTADTPYAMTYNAVCRLSSVCTASKTKSPTYTGANCMCHYEFEAPLSGVAARAPIVDACRVAIGERECRFDLEGVDNYSSRAHHPDSVLIPADSLMYLVEGNHSCKSTAVNCRAFAAPTLVYEGECELSTTGACATQGGCECDDELTGAYRCLVDKGDTSCPYFTRDAFAEEWTETTLVDDPSTYSEALCLEEEVGCESFTTQEGTSYFRDPGNKTCEYEEAAVYGGKDRSGWFRTSSSGEVFPCYPELLTGGDYYEIYKNADPSCSLDDLCDETDGCTCKKKFCKLAASPYTATTTECEADSDCATGYKCDTAGTKVCEVARGELSCGYNGWVGKCDAKYDMCEEFVDPMATSAQHPKGEPYYYIVNSKLDKTTCAGTVSLKRGCVLFSQSSDTRDLYSAAATYFKVDKDTPGVSTPVAPLNCDSSYPDNYCAKRCFSVQNGYCEKTGGSLDTNMSCYQNSSCTGTGYTGKCLGDNSWGLGCSDDADCTGKGEECETYAATPKNDTNIIIKVQPDRECAQWLACTDSDMNWDSDSGKWRSTCTGFGLCEGFKKTGSGSECAKWSEASAEMLTESEYTGRDVSYRGLDYSGYSLYNKYQPQHLVAVDIREGFCLSQLDGKQATSKPFDCYQNADCATGYKCGSKQPGVCVTGDFEKIGGPCDPSNVGYASTDTAKEHPLFHSDCVKSGSSTVQAFCSASALVTQRFGILGYYCNSGGKAVSCAVNSMCSDGKTACSASCTKTADCPSDSKGQASCVDGQCVFSLSGGPLIASTGKFSRESALQCRAYPESDSPFGYSVLADGLNGYITDTGMPEDRVTAFKSANVCHKNEDCECSYRKVSYGKAGTTVDYYSASGSSTSPPYKVCVGGDYDGKSCDKDDDCGEGGTCTNKTSDLLAYGWPGFCIDYDDSLFINNDQNRNDCILWFPVDQLSGMPDRYNQYREAGFQLDTDRDLLYCQDTQGLDDFAASCASSNYTWKAHTESGGSIIDGSASCKNPSGSASCSGLAQTTCGSTAGCSWYDVGGTIGCIDTCTYNAVTANFDSCKSLSGKAKTACVEGIIKANCPSSCNYTAPVTTTASDPSCYGSVTSSCTTTTNRYFRVSYEDENTRLECQYAGLLKSELAAIKIEFPSDECPSTVCDKDADGKPFLKHMWLHEGNDWQNGFNWNDNDDGISGVTPDSKEGAIKGEGASNKCISGLIDKSWNDDTCEGLGGNCLAAKLKFDSTGKVTGLVRTLCHNESLVSHTVPANVVVYFRETCKDFAYVHDTSQNTSETGTASVPWTDVLMLNKVKIDSYYERDVDPTESPNIEDEDDQEIAPYGSAVLPSLTGSGSWPRVPDNVVGTIKGQGVPVYSSEDGSAFMYLMEDTYIKDKTRDTFDHEEDALGGGDSIAGVPFACVGSCGISVSKDLGTSAKSEGEDRISQFFAYAWDVYSIDSSGIYKADSKGWDNRSEHSAGGMTPSGNQPAVVTVDTLQCTESSVCVEGKTAGLTVNGYTSGKVLSDEGAGKLKVSIKFYGYADKDHLPLRRKVVDYGDGSKPKSTVGFFKNHRGLYKDSSTDELTEYCSDGDEWGLTDDSCDSKYFEETKTYICSKAMTIGSSAYKSCDGVNYPCTDGVACIFKPRVQVLDNWGVCNGSCPGGPGQGNTCMNLTPSVSASTVGTTLATSDECLSDFSKITSNSNIYKSTKPWTEFAGTIVVYPAED